MQNIDPLTVKHLLEENKLKDLTIFYKRNVCQNSESKRMTLKFNLSYFFNEIIYSKTSFENISSICLFGSCLYRHIPIFYKTVPITVKRWGNIGIKRIQEEQPRPLPNDIDIFILLNNKLSEEEPDTVETIPLCERKRYRRVACYGGECLELISDDVSLPLHIVFRSIPQFLNGINNGDEIAEYVATFGVPFVGQKNFYKVLSHIKGNVRKDMHRVKWIVRKNQECEVFYLNKWWRNHNLSEERKRREAVNVPAEPSPPNRFEIMDV